MAKVARNGFKKYLVLLAGVLAIIVVFWFGFLPLARSFQNETRLVQEQDWSFTLRIVGGRIQDVNIDFNFQNAADVEKYAGAMRRENLDLFNSGPSEVTAVSIVFNRLISWEEADAFVKKYRVFAGGYDFRLVNKNDPNDRYTYGIGLVRDGKTGQGFDDNSARQNFNEYIAQVYENNTVYKGVIGMQVNLNRSDYMAVATDPRVFLVDMPGVIVKNKIAKQSASALQGLELDDDFNIPNNSPQLYRRLEDFGLVKPS